MKRKLVVRLICLLALLALMPAQVALAADPVCEIVGGAQYETLDEAVAAVPADVPTTIRLLQTINRTTTLTINGSKKITLDLNGYTLNVSVASGTALEVSYDGSLTTTGDGAMNLTGVLYGIDANHGGSADITGSVTATGDTGDHTNGTGVSVGDSGISVTVRGSVVGDMCGVSAYDSGRIYVTGNVTGHNVAVSADTGGQVRVTGDVTGSGIGIQADSATVQVGGKVTADGINGNGILAAHTADVKVDGGVTATHQGVLASYQSSLEVGGNVSVTNSANEGTAVIASTSATVTVGGNVTGGACGVGAETSGTITIAGNISSYYSGINTATGAEVFARGNITVDNTVGVGVNAYSAGEATVDGTIQAHKTMTFGESDGAEVTPTTKTGYRTYSDSADPPSYVWIKEAEIILPTVVTNAVDSASVTQTWAYISGKVTTHGTLTNIAYGFVYGLAANPEIGGAGVTDLPFGVCTTIVSSVYGQTVTGLSPGTTYHVRAYAITSGVTVYGEDREFATKIDITGLPDSQTIYVDGRVTLKPSPSGGTWTWDHAYVSLTANADAVIIKGLKAGTTTVTYTVGGSSKSVTIVIQKSELPSTGQNTEAVWILAGAAAAIVLAACLLRKRAAAQR